MKEQIPHLFDIIPSMIHEVESKTPPKEWYGGIAFPGEGIRVVAIGTDAFYSLHPDLRDRMVGWGHSQHTPSQTAEAARFHASEGAFIENVTGFSPDAIMDYSHRLTEEFKGQSMGPFPFPVDWIIR